MVKAREEAKIDVSKELSKLKLKKRKPMSPAGFEPATSAV